MSAAQGVNISKYMLGNNGAKSINVKPSTGNFKANSNIGAAGAGTRGSIARILSYLLAIIIVILVILLFIHFFITPIFRLKPGGSGIIPVPGFDDGKLFWNKTSASQIQNKDLPIASLNFGYTINLDVFVENPLQFSKHPRIFFSRGATRNETPQGDSLLGVLNNYNIVAALLPDTNDLVVSVLNKDNNMENVIVPNIPIQEPFRLSMVVMEQALEVYINGHLMRTRTFGGPPKDVKGDIYPAAGIEANVVKCRNLKIWSRLLTVSEIRQSTPSLSSAKDFGGTPMPSSTTCSTASAATMTDPQKGMDRFMKLSVDSVSDTTSQLL
jgi:hypothetical protein